MLCMRMQETEGWDDILCEEQHAEKVKKEYSISRTLKYAVNIFICGITLQSLYRAKVERYVNSTVTWM
jgi:hypothetical protein